MLAEKATDGSLDRLCNSVVNFANVESENLQIWLKHVILGSTNISSSISTTNIPTPTIATTNTYVLLM